MEDRHESERALLRMLDQSKHFAKRADMGKEWYESDLTPLQAKVEVLKLWEAYLVEA